MFVGRPYCRFLCPYGALLKIASVLSKWRVRVTPSHCTQCRLCENSCPFGALRQPESGKAEPRFLNADRKRLACLLILLPILVGGGAFAGWQFSAVASQLHPAVSLAARLIREQDTQAVTPALSSNELALERARQAPKEVFLNAAEVRRTFKIGGIAFGAWIGLVVGLKVLRWTVKHERSDYEPDRGSCFGCARCFEYCPNERALRGDVLAQVPTLDCGSPAPHKSPG
jgi:ferredoxin